MYAGMVIDFHVHIGRKEDWHPWVIEYLSEINPYLSKAFDKLMSPDGLEEYLVKEGIDYAVILAEDSPLTTGVVANSYVHSFCKGRKRFIPFASINPGTIPNPEESLEKCVRKMGFRGLKLYPTYQHFFPNQREIYPLYEKAVELDVPIMFHTGSSIYRNSKLKYGDPLHLDEVSTDFPELKIVMAHSGRGFWYDRAFFLSRLHKNLYMEISGLPPQKLLQYFPELEKNADKIIFGSDWPGVKSIKENIDALCSLTITKTTIEKILYRNAEKVLRIQT
ncbi:MAG: amidohydrolase [Thermoplasmatales archaeon]|nr:MAG: amidohydrolase [Thermoplasmatales archaeon]